MKTVLAVVVAVALIGGALYARTELLGGRGLLEDELAAQGGDDGSEAPPPAEQELRVACDAALADGCPATAERVDLGDLLAAFQAEADPYDVVVAPSLAIELIEGSQTSQVQFAEDRDVVATSPLLFAVTGSRAQTVADACGASVTWRCIADLVQSGSLTPGFPDPDSSSEGAMVFAAMTGGFLDDASYNTNSLGGADFLTWLDDLEGQARVTPTPIDALIQFNGARNDSAIAIEAAGLATINRSAQNTPEHFWPTPLAAVTVVTVGVGGADPDAVAAVAGAAAESLQSRGWRGADGDPLDEGPALDEDDGLPSGGVLFALQERWN